MLGQLHKAALLGLAYSGPHKSAAKLLNLPFGAVFAKRF